MLDRLVDDLAVVLLDGGSEGDGEELTFPVAVLPDEAAEGSWLRLWLSDGVVTAVETDAERTGATRERVQRKLERIRTRQGGGRFGR
ncbi:MAG: DUF3006 domain-containing protein [Acidimicrobiia bacterium]|nr:DUF3006 domain-containing protein [Acidimicrobiia bacterium]